MVALAAFIGYFRGGFGQRSYWLDSKAAWDSRAPDVDGPVLEKLGFGGGSCRTKTQIWFGNHEISSLPLFCERTEIQDWVEGRGGRGPT